MKTQIKKVGDAIIISMNGKLDFETHLPFREDLNKVTKQAESDSDARKIIFNFENLEFVGSSGISSFVQVLREFNSHSPVKPRYCHVKTEFRRIIEAFDTDALFEFFENEERAKKTPDQ